MTLTSLDLIFRAAESRPVGFFNSYDEESLMEFDELKRYRQHLEAQICGETPDLITRSKTFSQVQTKEEKRSEESDKLVAESDKLIDELDSIFGPLNSGPEGRGGADAELEELKIQAFSEMLDEILQESLNDFLEGERPVSTAGLKEYYRGLFRQAKKIGPDNQTAQSLECQGFKKLFKRFIN